MTTHTTLPLPAIGVLDIDGLHVINGSLAPITGAIRHVGDLYKGARRYGLAQLWLTDAWVRAADLPATLEAGGRFREVRHPFVSDGLAELHAFPEALGAWLALRKKGEAGSGVSLVFPLYDEHAVWGLDMDGATLLAALVAYAGAVGAPYYSSPGRTGTDLLQELGKRGAGAQREYPEGLPAPAGQAETVTELSWLRTLSPDERQRAYLHSYDKNAQSLSANVHLSYDGRYEQTSLPVRLDRWAVGDDCRPAASPVPHGAQAHDRPTRDPQRDLLSGQDGLPMARLAARPPQLAHRGELLSPLAPRRGVGAYS